MCIPILTFTQIGKNWDMRYWDYFCQMPAKKPTRIWHSWSSWQSWATWDGASRCQARWTPLGHTHLQVYVSPGIWRLHQCWYSPTDGKKTNSFSYQYFKIMAEQGSISDKGQYFFGNSFKYLFYTLSMYPLSSTLTLIPSTALLFSPSPKQTNLFCPSGEIVFSGLTSF